jgi:hypothetical protein
MYLRGTGCKGVNWIHLAHGKDQWRVLVIMVMNFRDPWKTGNFLKSWVTVSFSRTLHHGVSCVYCYCYFVSQSSEFAAITLCVASQRVILKVSVYFFIDSVRKLLDTPSYDGYLADFICAVFLWWSLASSHFETSQSNPPISTDITGVLLVCLPMDSK